MIVSIKKSIEAYLIILILTNVLGSKIYNMRYMKYIVIGFLIYFAVLIFLKNRKIIISKNKNIKNIVYSWLYISFIFLGLSIILQLIHGKISIRTFEEVGFILMPTISLLCILNLDERIDINIEKYIDIIFYTYILSFIIKFYDKFNIHNIVSISFVNSYSPFESEFSDIFLFLFVWYLVKNKNVRSTICFILCWISLKRIHVVLLIISYFVIKTRKRIMISKKSVYMMVFVNLILVLFMQYSMLSNNFSHFFESKFGCSFDAFTSGRSKIVRLFDSYEDAKLNGFGSTTEYLRPYKEQNIIDTDNLHADTLKIYYEMGIFALIIYCYLIYKGSINNMYIFILCIMYNAIIVGSHMIDNIMTNFMFLIICCSFSIYNEKDRRDNVYNES